MKNYNKILEAVNRGILLALDDFGDEEYVQHIKSKLINHRDYTKEYLDLMNEVVDLGLPSGTLWCKYNLGVDPNLLISPEDWYGDYYAWGELEPNKKLFDWSTYKFGEHYYGDLLKRRDCLIKYCNNPQKGYNQITKTLGFTDNLTQLVPEDDAAYLNKKLYNYKFHIPTKELCEELINCTKNYWVNNYDPNKTIHNSEDDGGIEWLNGRIFEGKNGNQLFIPAAGYRNGSIINRNVVEYNVWTSGLFLAEPIGAWCFFSNQIHTDITSNDRERGRSIRPVINLK